MRWSNKVSEENILLKKHVVDFYKFNKNEYVDVNNVDYNYKIKRK